LQAITSLFQEKGTDMEVRRTSATVLGEIRDPSVLPLLLQALTEKDWNFRYSVIEALARFEHPDIIGPVMKIATDPKEASLLRQGAIKVFLTNHSEKAVCDLIALLQDHDDKVVEAAFSVLQVLKSSYWPVIEQQKSASEQQFNWLLDFIQPGETHVLK